MKVKRFSEFIDLEGISSTNFNDPIERTLL
jgi:hypothetical protein